MPKFSYEAKKGPKEVIRGTIEAEDQDTAVDKINQMGYVPIRVVPVEEESHQQRLKSTVSARGVRGIGLFRKVRERELTIFMEQLASLVKSKVPLLEAMKVLHQQTENANLKNIISAIQSEIRDGRSLSHSLSKHPAVFSPLYVNMIASGEAAGVLEETLLRLVEFRNKEEEIKSRISTALAYPIFIVVVGVATVFFLLGFVIPKMDSLFNELGQALPLSTKILLVLGQKIKAYWYWALAIFTLLFLSLRKHRLTKKQKESIDRLKVKLPFLGDFIKKSVLGRFSRTLAVLLANGIPLFQAIKITIPTIDNEIFKSELNSVHQDITKGASLEQSIKKSAWFPRFVSNMLAVGEKGGNLEEALLEVANFYEREVDRATKIMTSLLEPAIILVMGLVVGFIVFAMLLPIFQINLGIQ